jgi:hypothetical protein
MHLCELRHLLTRNRSSQKRRMIGQSSREARYPRKIIGSVLNKKPAFRQECALQLPLCLKNVFVFGVGRGRGEMLI